MNFRLRLSFTERRRRMLAKKIDRLDRLEARTTITEPISFTGLSISALRGLVQLGLMSVYGGSNAPSPFIRAKEIEKQAGRAAPKPYAIPTKLLRSIDALALSRHAGGGAGSAAAASTAGSSAQYGSGDWTNDWLTLNAKPSTDAGSTGISTPWHPAKGAGGGAARLRAAVRALRGESRRQVEVQSPRCDCRRTARRQAQVAALQRPSSPPSPAPAAPTLSPALPAPYPFPRSRSSNPAPALPPARKTRATVESR